MLRLVSYCIASCIFCFLAIDVSAQLRINEVCSRNDNLIQDGHGDYPDWVEIKNTSFVDLLLSDFYLSDERSLNKKWRLPAQTLSSSAIEFFFCESKDTRPSISFSISSLGETIYLFNGSGAIIDSMVVPKLEADDSYGLFAGSRYFFDLPSPGFENGPDVSIGYALSPKLNLSSGIYNNGISLRVIPQLNHKVYYNTNGKQATAGVNEFPSNLFLDSTVFLQCISTRDSFIQSPPSVYSFILRSAQNLPIVSVQVDPDSMFSFDRGIYSLGPNADSVFPYYGANFWEDRTIPAFFSYYDEQGRQLLSQLVDMKIHGGTNSRNKPQRPLRFISKTKYGASTMDFSPFSQRPNKSSFKRVLLRNTGSDFGLAQIRDPFFHSIALNNELNIDVLAAEPVEVYINGEYWGMQYLRERIDKNYLENTYGAEQDSVIILEEENARLEGDPAHFAHLIDFVKQNDLKDESNFQYIDSLVDLSNLKDYYALQFYAGNADWPANNLKYWKPSFNEGKYRYLMFDMDATMQIFGWVTLSFNSIENALINRADSIHPILMNALLEHQEFKRTFVNRFADLLNTSLGVEKVENEFYDLSAQIEPVIVDHFSRWNLDEAGWIDHHEGRIPEFLEQRTTVVQSQIQNYFSFPSLRNIRLSQHPPNAGKIKLNSIEPPLPFEGVYFESNMIDLEAKPELGWEFEHWEVRGSETKKYFEKKIQVNPDSELEIKAIYSMTGLNIKCYPNPSLGLVECLFNWPVDEAIVVQVFDVLGRELLSYSAQANQGTNVTNLDLRNLQNGNYLVRINGQSDQLNHRLQKVQ